MTSYSTVYLRFPSDSSMVTRLRSIIPNVRKADLPAAQRNPHNSHRIDVDLLFGTGRLYRRAGGTDEEPTYEEKDGVHVNLLVEDGAELPDWLDDYRIYPVTPDCVFG